MAGPGVGHEYKPVSSRIALSCCAAKLIEWTGASFLVEGSCGIQLKAEIRF
jgi:hypothetical protein